MKKLVLSLAFLFVFTSFAVADPVLGPSLWKNNRGSTLEIKSVTAGFFFGTFINRAKGTECKYIPYNAPGLSSLFGVWFSVNFDKCYTITNWSGHVSDDGRTMTTTFQLFYTPPGKPTQVIPGSDVFRRFR